MLRAEKLPENKTGHDSWLVGLMKKFGFRPRQAGLCFGVACMAIQAALVGELSLFDERFFDLATLHFDFSNLANVADEMKWGLIAFLERVELYQQSYLYPELFTTKTTLHQSMSFFQTPTLSDKLMEKGGMRRIDHVAGVYSLDDLKSYFASLNSCIPKEGCDYPLTLLLRSHCHAISVGYDQKQKKWFCVNADWINHEHNKGVYYFASTDEIALAVHNAFYADKTLAFSTSLYTSKDQQFNVAKLNKAWRQTADWKRLHQVSSEYAQRASGKNVSALYLAVLENDLRKAKKLLQLGANVNLALTSTGETLLHIAAKQGLTDMFDLLLSHGAKVDVVDENGNGLMHAAARFGHTDIINRLTNSGTDVNIKSAQTGEAALHMAAGENHIDTIVYLLNQKADINLLSSKYRYSPLILACWKGHMDVMRILLQAGANPNLPDNSGLTPLYVVTNFHRIEMINALLAAGADPTIEHGGFTPLELAEYNNDQEAITALKAGCASTLKI